VHGVYLHKKALNLETVLLELVNLIGVMQTHLVDLLLVLILQLCDLALLLLIPLLEIVIVLDVYLDLRVLLGQVLCERVDLRAFVVNLDLFDLKLVVPLVYLLLHLVHLLLQQEYLQGLRIG